MLLDEHMKTAVDKIVTLLKTNISPNATPTRQQQKKLRMQAAYKHIAQLLNNNSLQKHLPLDNRQEPRVQFNPMPLRPPAQLLLTNTLGPPRVHQQIIAPTTPNQQHIYKPPN